MADYSSKTVCVVDNGLFCDVSTVLARSFGKVYLYIPWENAYPKGNQLIVGKGLEGVEKVDSIWPILNKVDLFVFPDIYHGPLQEHLESLGKRVWGSRMGEEMELFREFSKEAVKRSGLAVGDYTAVVGVDALRDHLKAHKNQYVKISRTRGDMETFKAPSYRLVEPRIDELEHRLGAKKTITHFICEDAIPEAVEVGYDGYTIDGQFPSVAMTGIEVKDKGYVGVFKKYRDMSDQVREINRKMAPALKRYRYRNFWCAEARITKDGTPWVIDPCARFGSPPSELAMLMYTNLPDIMWHGAAGELVDPIPAGKWGAEVMLISSWANENWQAIDFPKAIRQHVILHFPVVIDGRYYVTPQGFDLPCIGAVSAVGDTMEAAVKQVRQLAEQVKGYYIEAPVDCFDEAEHEIAHLKQFGIDL